MPKPGRYKEKEQGLYCLWIVVIQVTKDLPSEIQSMSHRIEIQRMVTIFNIKITLQTSQYHIFTHSLVTLQAKDRGACYWTYQTQLVRLWGRKTNMNLRK
jgi:hypothetical protein